MAVAYWEGGDDGGLLAGTLVHTPAGPRPIDALRAGDEVTCVHPARPAEQLVRRVRSVAQAHVGCLYFVTWQVPYPPEDWPLKGAWHPSEFAVAAGGQAFFVLHEVGSRLHRTPDKPIDDWVSVAWINRVRERKSHVNGGRDFDMQAALAAPPRWGYASPILATALADEGVCFHDMPWWTEERSGIRVAFSASGARVERAYHTTRPDEFVPSRMDVPPLPDQGRGHAPDSIERRSLGYRPMAGRVCRVTLDGEGALVIGPAGVLARPAGGR